MAVDGHIVCRVRMFGRQDRHENTLFSASQLRRDYANYFRSNFRSKTKASIFYLIPHRGHLSRFFASWWAASYRKQNFKSQGSAIWLTIACRQTRAAIGVTISVSPRASDTKHVTDVLLILWGKDPGQLITLYYIKRLYSPDLNGNCHNPGEKCRPNCSIVYSYLWY
jgi:hypothetical protein